MNRTLLLMAVSAVATSGVKAPSGTYQPDSPQKKHKTGLGNGTGAPSPQPYYTPLHKKKKK